MRFTDAYGEQSCTAGRSAFITGQSVSPANAFVADFLGTFLDYPPRMKAASFTIDQAVAKLEATLYSGR